MNTPHHPDPFQPTPATPRVLITAGPTYEPIDRVRFLGNRSSGRLGIALADAAAERGWPCRLLLGPTCLLPSSSAATLTRFSTAQELQGLLTDHLPSCDILIMAAAVADFRPAEVTTDKLRRLESGRLLLELVPTDDLLAQAASEARPDQLIAGFALEPAEGLVEAARRKLARKSVDAIVANPIETLDAESITAYLITAGQAISPQPGALSKTEFAAWLLSALRPMWDEKQEAAR
ncbi:MAG: phosphopantothenoylcysteine decarboxylase [Phycisphaerales bacterium]